MAVVEDIELRVTVNGTAAQKGLDAVRDAAQRMGGALGTVVGSIDGMQKGARDLQQKLAPTAAAISGVSSALGQAGGEAGKVVAGFGQMAAAFGAGGPWAVAIVGATMLVDQYIVAQKEMEENARSADAALNTFGDGLRNRSGKGLEWIREKADEAAKAVRDFGKTSAQVTLETAKMEVVAAEARIAGIDATIERRNRNIARLKAEMSDPAVINSRRDIIDRLESLKDENILLRKSGEAREDLTAKLAAGRVEVARLAEEQAKLNELENLPAGSADLGKPVTISAGGGGARAGNIPAMLKRAREERLAMLADARRDIEEARAAEQAARDAATESEIDADIERWAAAGQAFRDYEKMKTDIVQEETDARNQYIADGAKWAAGVMIAGTQQYLDDLITGQEHATERFQAFIMKQAGQALISEGVKLFGMSITSGLSGNVPLAAAQLGASATLVTAGVGLGGAATALMHTAAGGTVGEKLPSSTSGGGGDMAARARPARPGMGGGGGTNLTIVYGGLSGPSADDGARALGRGLERARRRGLAL